MWEIAVCLAVAGGIYDDVFLCCHFSPRDVLDEILDLTESVSEGFPTYFCTEGNCIQDQKTTDLFLI